MGYIRVAVGQNILGLEGEVAWATPGSFTLHNFPCSEDGKNCVVGKPAVETYTYQDPSTFHASATQDASPPLLRGVSAQA